MSSIGSIDPGAVKAIYNMSESLSKNGLSLALVGCSLPLLDQMSKCKLIQRIGTDKFFPTIHDAVIYCSQKLQKEIL